MNKLVTLCSHDHQFQFHLISQIFCSIDPEHFQGKLAFRISRRPDFSQFSSLWMLLWVFILTSSSHRIFPRRRGKHTYISVQGCCFLCEEITLSAFKVWKCNKIWQNTSKIYQTHFAFNCQLPTSNASVLLDLLTTVSKSCRYGNFHRFQKSFWFFRLEFPC